MLSFGRYMANIVSTRCKLHVRFKTALSDRRHWTRVIKLDRAGPLNNKAMRFSFSYLEYRFEPCYQSNTIEYCVA